MRILYLGRRSGTSHHRGRALRRLGHDVTIVDLRRRLADAVPFLGWTWLSRWIRRTGALFLSRPVEKLLERHPAFHEKHDLVVVDEIALAGPRLVGKLRERFGPVACYVIDDPFGTRDGPKWRLFLEAVPEYDLITVVREPNVEEAYDHGALDVLRVYRSADEVAHAPRELTPEERERWSSDVAFVGTWFPERGPFLAELVERGVPLSLWGDRWRKAEEWPVLEPHWRGPALTGDDYVKALQCAKVCLGLVSHENRDLHTQRSLEIPYVGSVLCAERTEEHLALYEEGREAAFWDDAAECTEKCRALLQDDGQRALVAERGRRRCLENGWLNERVMARIVERVTAEPSGERRPRSGSGAGTSGADPA